MEINVGANGRVYIDTEGKKNGKFFWATACFDGVRTVYFSCQMADTADTPRFDWRPATDKIKAYALNAMREANAEAVSSMEFDNAVRAAKIEVARAELRRAEAELLAAQEALACLL